MHALPKSGTKQFLQRLELGQHRWYYLDPVARIDMEMEWYTKTTDGTGRQIPSITSESAMGASTRLELVYKAANHTCTESCLLSTETARDSNTDAPTLQDDMFMSTARTLKLRLGTYQPITKRKKMEIYARLNESEAVSPAKRTRLKC
ncbi:hypothetical protein K438DRAFT_1746792 [Mycena galopus ATCC 62051]|nr:hypothetical protein K438DRAFT_1746792 [Mycena galopus ATCC 62051]